MSLSSVNVLQQLWNSLCFQTHYFVARKKSRIMKLASRDTWTPNLSITINNRSTVESLFSEGTRSSFIPRLRSFYSCFAQWNNRIQRWDFVQNRDNARVHSKGQLIGSEFEHLHLHGWKRALSTQMSGRCQASTSLWIIELEIDGRFYFYCPN